MLHRSVRTVDQNQGPGTYPARIEAELRSDHAGETSAVWVYRGILAFCRAPEIRETERRHLALTEMLLPRRPGSRLLRLWRLAGFAIGAIPAMLGPRAVFITIEAVETFVDRHLSCSNRGVVGLSRVERTAGAA